MNYSYLIMAAGQRTASLWEGASSDSPLLENHHRTCIWSAPPFILSNPFRNEHSRPQGVSLRLRDCPAAERGPPPEFQWTIT